MLTPCSIAFPFQSDQSLNAMLISLVHKIGYELIQVRTGENGLKRLYRITSEDEQPKNNEDAWRAEMRDVLKRAFGEDGKEKRANLARLRERMLASWQENGETMNEFRMFLDQVEKTGV